MPRHPFPDHEGLIGAHGTGIRPALLRELTDLYVQKPSHTPDDERIFTELALRLIEHVDAAERARIGARLAAYPRAPLAVLRRLAEPDSSPVTVEPVPSPMEIPFKDMPRLAAEARPETLGDIFFDADSAERRLILQHLDVSPISLAAIRHDGEMAPRLEQSALMRSPNQFSVILSQALSIPPATALRIAHDPLGETLVAAVKALAIPAPTLQRILLFLNPRIGHSVERFFDLCRLYDEIGEDSARRMVAVWRMSAAAPSHKPAHHTQLRDNEKMRARDFARHDARPVGDRRRAERDQPDRFRITDS